MKARLLTILSLFFIFSCDFYEELEYKLHIDQGFYPNQPLILEYDYTPGFNLYLFLELSTYEGPNNYQSDYYGWFTIPAGKGMQTDIRELVERDIPPGDYKLETRQVISKGGRTTPMDDSGNADETMYFRISDFTNPPLNTSAPSVVALYNRIQELGFPEGLKHVDLVFGGYDQSGFLSGLDYFYTSSFMDPPDTPQTDLSNVFEMPDNVLSLGPGELNWFFNVVGAAPPLPGGGIRPQTAHLLSFNYNNSPLKDFAGVTFNPSQTVEFEVPFQFLVDHPGGNIFSGTILTIELWDTSNRIDGPFLYEDAHVFYDPADNRFKLDGGGYLPLIASGERYEIYICNPTDDYEMDKRMIFSLMN